MVLAFALATRGRWRWAAAALAGAVLLKQFAVVAIPFLALMMVKQGVPRAELKRCAAVFAGVIAVVCAAVPDRRSRARSTTTP